MELTQARARALFDYREDGVLLWRVTRGKAKAGAPAGHVRKDGYVHVMADQKMYLAHRIIFLMHHGYMPPGIDHRDTDNRNNRIDNLRPATQTLNNANARRRRDNTSGQKGVSFDTARGLWAAKIHVKGRTIPLGRYETMDEATSAYAAAAAKHFGEFARP